VRITSSNQYKSNCILKRNIIITSTCNQLLPALAILVSFVVSNVSKYIKSKYQPAARIWLRRPC